MSSLNNRRDAPRWPTKPQPRTYPADAVMAALIIGILCGLMILTVVASIFVYIEGGHLCFSRDGISCIKEGLQP